MPDADLAKFNHPSKDGLDYFIPISAEEQVDLNSVSFQCYTETLENFPYERQVTLTFTDLAESRPIQTIGYYYSRTEDHITMKLISAKGQVILDLVNFSISL